MRSNPSDELAAEPICVLRRLDFAEASLVAVAERTEADAVASFDRSLDRVGSVRRVECCRA
jgi:predicted nucleic acid-binding protein